MMAPRGTLVTHLRMAATVALVGGGAIGVGAGAWLSAGAHSSLVLTSPAAKIAAVILLGAAGALASSIALCGLALVVAVFEDRFPRLLSAGRARLYSVALVIGFGSLHAFLTIGFVVVRDLASARGLLLMAMLVAACIALFGLGVWLPPHRRTEWMGLSMRRLLIAYGLVVVIGWSSWAVLQSTLAAPSTRTFAAPSTQSLTAILPPARPNVILISIDTLRADHLSGYGHHRPTTPNIDQFFAAGTTFLEARSQAPWTLPAHASMMTSLYPSTHGARFYSVSRFLPRGLGDRLAEHHITLAEVLRQAGYRTGAFTSVEWLGEQFGLGQGFDTLEMDRAGHPASVLVDRALAWLDPSDRTPYFLFLHFFDVHEYSSPRPFDEMYRDPAYDGTFRRDVFRNGNLYDRLTRADVADLEAGYDGALSYVDAELGRLFRELERQNLLQSTLVILTSDHGEEFWDHGGTSHGFTLYDEQLRVPLLIRPPAADSVARTRHDAAAALIDIPPTVVDYLALAPLPVFVGISLKPLIEGVAGDPARTLFAEDSYYYNLRAAIEGDLKLIGRHFPPLRMLNADLFAANLRSFYRYDEDMLYRLDTDPAEMRNLFAERPSGALDLERKLIEHVAASAAGTPFALDSEMLEQLRSLGYVQ